MTTIITHTQDCTIVTRVEQLSQALGISHEVAGQLVFAQMLSELEMGESDVRWVERARAVC